MCMLEHMQMHCVGRYQCEHCDFRSHSKPAVSEMYEETRREFIPLTDQLTLSSHTRQDVDSERSHGTGAEKGVGGTVAAHSQEQQHQPTRLESIQASR